MLTRLWVLSTADIEVEMFEDRTNGLLTRLCVLSLSTADTEAGLLEGRKQSFVDQVVCSVNS